MNRSMRILYVFFIFLIPILIYAPTFKGESLWDDHYFIFDRYGKDSYSYSIFWKDALWPFFESTTLTFYKLFKTETAYWHVTNFIFHMLNGILLGKVVRYFRPSLALPLTIVFWVHPLCTLTVAWIVQLKTLMCLFFSLLGLYVLVSRKRTNVTLCLSLFLFFLSVMSKSASIVLPFMAFFFLVLKRSWRPHALKTLPFMLISILSLVRMSFHQNLQLTIKNSEATIATLVDAPPQSPSVPSEKKSLPPTAAPTTAVTPAVPAMPETPAAPTAFSTTESIAIDGIPFPADNAEVIHSVESYSAPTKFKILAYTISYYIGAPWFPVNLSPIHSNYRGGFGLVNYFGFLIITLSLGAMFWRTFTPVFFLACQLMMLSPFLGFIAAPFMTFSIVSEQHLYLALPFAILSQLFLIQKIFNRHHLKIVFVFFVVLSGITANYSLTFKNEENFYRQVLAIYPYDRLAALNLANHYMISGRIRQALFVLKKAIQQAEERPYLKTDIMHPYIMKSYEQMKLLE